MIGCRRTGLRYTMADGKWRCGSALCLTDVIAILTIIVCIVACEPFQAGLVSATLVNILHNMYCTAFGIGCHYILFERSSST